MTTKPKEHTSIDATVNKVIEALQGVKTYDASDLPLLREKDWSDSKQVVKRLYPRWRGENR